MTFSVAGQQRELAKHIGFQEHPYGSNRQPWTEWQFYGRARNLPYCGSGADYCSVEGGGFEWPWYAQSGKRGSAYVPTIVVVAKRMGIWLPPSAIAPIGSYPIFDWNRDGNYDHVGIKAARADGTDPDDGNRFFSGEFNTSNGCFYKVRDRKYLVCWIALPLAGQSAPPAPPPPPIPPKVPPMYDPPLARDLGIAASWEVDAHLIGHPNEVNRVVLAQVAPNGDVYAFGVPYRPWPTKDKDFAGRIASRIQQSRHFPFPRYEIVATTGEVYEP